MKYIIRRAVVVIVVIAIICGMALGILKAFPERKIVGYETCEVGSGDTLWKFAKTSNGYGIYDIRDIIDDIAKESKCSSNLKVHDIIYVPIYEIND